jgi:DNA-binding MarR family transcriptional regulator
MGRERNEIIERTLDRLHELMAGLQIATLPAWLEIGLTLSQVRCLFALQRVGPTSLGGLAERLEIGSPAACVVVDQLVQQGYVDRSADPKDRRRVLLSVSPDGESLVAGVRRARRRLGRDWLEMMSEEEIARLFAALEPMVSSMRAQAGDPASGQTEVPAPE